MVRIFHIRLGGFTVARLIGKLTSLRLESLTKARKGGMTSDGGGLYFRIDPRHGGASWCVGSGTISGAAPS